MASPLPHEAFGQNVRAARTRLGWSQMQLGNEAGLHFTEISKLERAVQEPRLSTIVAIAKALGVKPGELLDGIG